MPLDDGQLEQLRLSFRSNMVVPDCPYCAGYGWSAREIVAVPVVDDRGNPGPEGTSVALVQIVCNNCGHVTLFDAKSVGLLRS